MRGSGGGGGGGGSGGAVAAPFDTFSDRKPPGGDPFGGGLAAGGGGGGPQGVFQNIRITADEVNNLLLVHAESRATTGASPPSAHSSTGRPCRC